MLRLLLRICPAYRENPLVVNFFRKLAFSHARASATHRKRNRRQKTGVDEACMTGADAPSTGVYYEIKIVVHRSFCGVNAPTPNLILVNKIGDAKAVG